MSDLQLAVWLSIGLVALLALAGWRPYVDEFSNRAQQLAAALLLIGVLALTVVAPVAALREGHEIDAASLWLPMLFIGHVVLGTFLVAWWALRGRVPVVAFRAAPPLAFVQQLRVGLWTGILGWMVTVVVTGASAAVVGTFGGIETAGEVPPVMIWLAHLPPLDKLLIVAVAMTVEEAFFRGFLQARFGLFVSTAMFACSHFSYGLPFLIIGVLTISVIIGQVFARTRALLPCIIAHGVFDAIQLFVVLPWAVQLWAGGA